MSYTARIDDISPFLENNHVGQSNDEASTKIRRSSNNEHVWSKDTIGSTFQEDGAIPLQDELLYDTIRKMSSGEGNTDDENEEDSLHSLSGDLSLDKSELQSALNEEAENRLHVQVPYTSSPHPQRHSRWTSRFLTHPSHWKPSSNTPAIPLPLPDPQQSLEQKGNRKASKHASKVSPLTQNAESAKNQNTFKEWDSRSISPWTMDLPHMSSLYNSISYKSQDKIKEISWPVTVATVTRSNSGAHTNDEDYSPSFYVDTYFADNKYSNALSSDQQNINVASRNHRVIYGDTKSTDAKNIAPNNKNDKISSNNGIQNLATGKDTSSPNGAPSFKSTSALSSPWSSSDSSKLESNVIANNDIWSEDNSPHSKSSYKTNDMRSSMPSRPHEIQKSQRYENNNNVHQFSDDFTQQHVRGMESKEMAYGGSQKRTFDDISEKSDYNKIKGDYSGYFDYSSRKTDGSESNETDLELLHSEDNIGSTNEVIKAKAKHQVPAHSSLRIGSRNSSRNSSPEKDVSIPDTISTKTQANTDQLTIHIGNDEVDEYYSSSNMRTDNIDFSSKIMQNDEHHSSEQIQGRTHVLRQTTINNPMYKKKDKATKVQNEDLMNDRTTKKKLSVPLQLDDYGGNKKIINDVEDHHASVHLHNFNGPRTSALKSDKKRNSSILNNKGDIKNRNRTLISDTHASPDLSTPVFISPKRRPKEKEVNIPPQYKSKMNWSPSKIVEVKDFYRNYNAMDGAVTAIVLGGFFAFVCLLVVYKTKIKPMWKNRGKRLTTTPATASVAENPMNSGANGDGIESLNFGETGKGSTCMLPLDGKMHECDDEEHPCVQNCDDDCEHCVVGDDQDEDDAFEGFECIPLQTVNCSEEDEDDIFFLDEFGNYVFPISTPTSAGAGGGGASGNVFMGASTNCSCQPSADELETEFTRRVSQASGASNAYTVKSLPGAYLYIPVLEPPMNSSTAAITSFSSVKRSLSDPEIHFTIPIPFGGHPIILTVNPTSDRKGIGDLHSLSTRLRCSGIDYKEGGGNEASSEQANTAKTLTIGTSKFQQRSYSMQQETSPYSFDNDLNQDTNQLFSLPLKKKFDRTQEDLKSENAFGCGALYGSLLRREKSNKSAIDVQVIPATPNMSPAESRGSSSGDEMRNIGNDEIKVNEMKGTSRTPAITRSASAKETKSNLTSNTPSIAVQSTVEVLSSSEQEYSYTLSEVGACQNGAKSKDSARRKVSFSSDDAVDGDENKCPSDDSMAVAAGSLVSSCDEEITPTSVRRRKGGKEGNVLRAQMTIPGASNNLASMSYLQVPGQPTVIIPAVAPQLSQEAKKAQTSSQARKRRATRLMKAGSFCSITSEGDGDIFELTGELKQNENSAMTTSNHSLPPGLGSTSSEDKESRFSRSLDLRKPSDPLSEYSEFVQDDCHSDISELFGHKSPNKHPSTSTRDSSDSSGDNYQQNQESAVYNLNLENEDIVFVEIPYQGEFEMTENGLYKKVQKEPSVENTPPRQKSVIEKNRKISVDVGVQSPPPMFKSEEKQPEQPEKHRKGSNADVKKKRKVMTVKKESFVMPDTSVPSDGQAECEIEEELYESSSCSISIGSDNESSHQILTVPVTIEHPPPYMRPTAEEGPICSNIGNNPLYVEGDENSGKNIKGSSKHVDERAPKPSSQHHHHHHHHRHGRRRSKDKYAESPSAQEKHSKQKENISQDTSMSGSFQTKHSEGDENNFSRVITTSEAGCQQAVPSSFVSRYYSSSTSMPNQGLKVIKSADCSPLPQTKHNYHHPTGVKSEEPQRRAPISVEDFMDSETNRGFNIEQTTEVDQSEATLAPGATSTGVGIRMVLVRDIGIQVSGNSPNLNLHRKFFKKTESQLIQNQNVMPISTEPNAFPDPTKNKKNKSQDHSDVEKPLHSRGAAAPFSTDSTSIIRSSENQTQLSTASSNITTNPVNLSSSSNLSKKTIDNKKDSSKKFPPEILF